MSANLLLNAKQQFIDTTGKPLVGGTVGMYVPNTLIPKDTWKDENQTILNTNPIVLDSRGQAIIYGVGSYRQIVKDILGNLIWDQLVPATDSTSPTGYIDVSRFGAVGGSDKDTPAIQAAFAQAAVTGQPVWIPRTAQPYKIVPNVLVTNEAGPEHCLVQIFDNMCVQAQTGAHFRLADNMSTDASPQNFSMFFSSGVTQGWSIDNLIMDMNGQNNPISPGRPTVYNLNCNMAMIEVSGTPLGVAARASNTRITNCSFINTSGTNCVVMGQTNSLGTTMGSGWYMESNFYNNNGLDTSDHTSVYMWADNCTALNDIFTGDTPYHTVGKTGATAAYEMHGSNGVITNARVLANAYERGIRINGNYSTPNEGCVVNGGFFQTVDFGVYVERLTAAETTVRYWQINDISVELDDYTYSGRTGPKSGWVVSCPYQVSDGVVNNPTVRKIGTTYGAVCGEITSCTGAASQTIANIRCINATGYNLTRGVVITTNALNSLGYVEVTNSSFSNFVAATDYSPPLGVIVNLIGGGGISDLIIDNNKFRDMDDGIVILGSGTIGNYYLGPQFYSNISSSTYDEAGVTVTTRTGIATAPLPTTATHLPSGSIYNNAGTPTISP